MLQCRSGKRTARAAVRIAVELVHEGVIAEAEALEDQSVIADCGKNLLAETLGCATEPMACVHVGLPVTAPRRERIEDLSRALGELWYRALPLVESGSEVHR